LVFVDPLPPSDEKAEVERAAFEGESLPETAQFFAECGGDYKEGPLVRDFTDALDAIGAVHEPGRMLEVGVGTGLFLHLARRRGWQPFGIDIAEGSARQAAADFDLSVDVGDFADYAYDPTTFDCVAMLDVLEHTLDPVSVLAKAYSVLRPGGVIYIAVPNQHSMLTRLVDVYAKCHGPATQWMLERLYVIPHLYYFTPGLLSSVLASAGFEMLSVEGAKPYLGRYGLPLWIRVPAEIVLRIGSVLGMPARTLVLARRPVA
jgi:SAM-dependent methyltransferase